MGPACRRHRHMRSWTRRHHQKGVVGYIVISHHQFSDANSCVEFMFVDPRPLLQRHVSKHQPTYRLKLLIPPARFILNQSAHIPTDIPMLNAVILVVRQMPCQRSRPAAATATAAATAATCDCGLGVTTKWGLLATSYTQTTDVPMLTHALGCICWPQAHAATRYGENPHSPIYFNHPHPQYVHESIDAPMVLAVLVVRPLLRHIQMLPAALLIVVFVCLF